MRASQRILLAPTMAVAVALGTVACAAPAAPLPAATTVEATPVDVVGSALDGAWTTLAGAGFTVTAVDIRDGRSIWDRSNWVVVSQDIAGSEVTLGVEKRDDPECWVRATTCAWVTVFEFDATGDAESAQFILDGGPARLTYAVAAASTTEGKRTADIYFQDLAAHTESSSIDTIINVDDPGTDVVDLGARDGTFFLMAEVQEYDVTGVDIHVTVEQMRPANG